MSSNTFFVMMLGLLCFGDASIAESLPKSTQIYRDEALGVEFQYPNEFRAAPCSACDGSEAPCIGFTSKSSGKEGAEVDCSFFVTTSTGSVDDAASKHILFERIDKVWVKSGRADTSSAKKISGAKLKGIIAGASCGIFDEFGFHAAAGTCHTAFVSDDIRSATIEGSGTLDEDVVMLVAKTFTFFGGVNRDNKLVAPTASAVAE